MLEPNADVAEVARVIELAVAPVFLLAGISGLLVVLTNRLARIIDRSRVLRAAESESSADQDCDQIQRELKAAFVRGRVVNFAILMATLSALMVCLVIVTLFMGFFQSAEMSIVISGMFVVCISFLALSFCGFLAEVLISTAYLKSGMMTSRVTRPGKAENRSPGKKGSDKQ